MNCDNLFTSEIKDFIKKFSFFLNRKSGLNLFVKLQNDGHKRDIVVVDYYAIMFFCDFLNCLIIIFTYQYFGVSLYCKIIFNLVLYSIAPLGVSSSYSIQFF